MSTPSDSPLVASLRALLAKQAVPGGRDTPALVLASLRDVLAKHDSAIAAPVAVPAAVAAPVAAVSPRAALLARLEASTDNDEKWALAEAFNDLPGRDSF